MGWISVALLLALLGFSSLSPAQDPGVDLARFGDFLKKRTETAGGLRLSASNVRLMLREFGANPKRLRDMPDAAVVDFAIRALERIRPIEVARSPKDAGLNTAKLGQMVSEYSRDIGTPLTPAVVRGMLMQSGMSERDVISLSDEESIYLVQRYLNPGGGPSTREMTILTALERQYQGFIAGHAPGLVEPRKSTVAFFDEDARRRNPNPKPLVLGTAIGPELVLTKASEVERAGRLQCEYYGRLAWGEILQTWRDHDLAVVRVRGLGLKPVRWHVGAFPPVGTFIAAPSHDSDEPVGIGLVAVSPRNLSDKNKGWLGIALGNVEGRVGVLMVVPDSPAARAGIRVDDIVTAVNGRPIRSVPDLVRTIGAKQPGERIRISRISGGVPRGAEIQLINRPPEEREEKPKVVGGEISETDGELSRVRKGFPRVFQTDFPILPQEIGSPVVDLRGNVLGITIARSSRIETFAIPAETVREVLRGFRGGR